MSADAHDSMLEALHQMRQAARVMRESRDALVKATADYVAAQTRFEAACEATPIKPVLNEDLPIVPIAQMAATAVKELG